MAGNKWYKTDLHLHSPESVCFKNRDNVTAEEWIEECIKKGLDCVALTDHNSGNNIDEYKRLALGRGLVFFLESKLHAVILALIYLYFLKPRIVRKL